jgi:hypothetical protein
MKSERLSDLSHSVGPLAYTARHENYSPYANRRTGGHLLDLRSLLLPA